MFGSRKVAMAYHDYAETTVAGPDHQAFLQQKEKLLAEIESNISAYLDKDQRWAVFLIKRLGHHEWVPAGKSTSTGDISDVWLGNWALSDVFSRVGNNWFRDKTLASGTKGVIRRNGDSTFVTFKSTKSPYSPIADTEQCQLRYSGGLTYLPSTDPEAALSRETALGYLSTYPIEELAELMQPLNPYNRYKQVLLNCEQGESLNSQRTRYLLLANDIMLEVASDSWAPEYVRHFKRVQ
jgi:hypothetical protein